MSQREPIFNVPPAVMHFLTVILVTHLVLTVLWYYDANMYEWAFASLAMVPLRYVETTLVVPGSDLAYYISFVSYMFVHAGLEHLLINSFFILAFGSAIARRIGYGRFVLFTLFCGIVGILLHLWIYWGSAHPVIGASAAASGYLAGTLVILLSAFRNQQIAQINYAPSEVKLMTVGQTLTDVRFLFLVLIWGLVNWFVGEAGLGVDDNARVAWEAHLGGFGAGLIAIFAMDRDEDAENDIED